MPPTFPALCTCTLIVLCICTWCRLQVEASPSGSRTWSQFSAQSQMRMQHDLAGQHAAAQRATSLKSQQQTQDAGMQLDTADQQTHLVVPEAGALDESAGQVTGRQQQPADARDQGEGPLLQQRPDAVESVRLVHGEPVQQEAHLQTQQGLHEGLQAPHAPEGVSRSGGAAQAARQQYLASPLAQEQAGEQKGEDARQRAGADAGQQAGVGAAPHPLEAARPAQVQRQLNMEPGAAAPASQGGQVAAGQHTPAAQAGRAGAGLGGWGGSSLQGSAENARPAVGQLPEPAAAPSQQPAAERHLPAALAGASGADLGGQGADVRQAGAAPAQVAAPGAAAEALQRASLLASSATVPMLATLQPGVSSSPAPAQSQVG